MVAFGFADFSCFCCLVDSVEVGGKGCFTLLLHKLTGSAVVFRLVASTAGADFVAITIIKQDALRNDMLHLCLHAIKELRHRKGLTAIGALSVELLPHLVFLQAQASRCNAHSLYRIGYFLIFTLFLIIIFSCFFPLVLALFEFAG